MKFCRDFDYTLYKKWHPQPISHFCNVFGYQVEILNVSSPINTNTLWHTRSIRFLPMKTKVAKIVSIKSMWAIWKRILCCGKWSLRETFLRENMKKQNEKGFTAWIIYNKYKYIRKYDWCCEMKDVESEQFISLIFKISQRSCPGAFVMLWLFQV